MVIVEDDPYYFLQEGPYVCKSERASPNSISIGDEASYISSLEPSFLKLVIFSANISVYLTNFSWPRFDYQGRVIRLDTFSKVCLDIYLSSSLMVMGSDHCSR